MDGDPEITMISVVKAEVEDIEIKEESVDDYGLQNNEESPGGLGCFYQVECNPEPTDCLMEVEDILRHKNSRECPRAAEIERLEARVGRLECLLELLLSKVATSTHTQPQSASSVEITPKKERAPSPLHSSMDLATRLSLQQSSARQKTKTLSAENTPLINAARAGHLPSVKTLLSKHPAPVEVGRALHAAGSAEVVQALSKAEPNIVHGLDGAKALCIAAEKGRATVLQALLDAGADPNTSNRYTLTALHKAALKGHTQCVQLLLHKGADVAATTSTQWTAMHMAAKSGVAECISALVKAGADVDASDNAGCTALHYAAGCNHEKTVQLLLKAGACTSIKNGQGKTPIDLATAENVVALLKEMGKTEGAAHFPASDEDQE